MQKSSHAWIRNQQSCVIYRRILLSRGHTCALQYIGISSCVAVPVCGRFGFLPFQSVAVSVCGRSGLWPFRFVAVMTCYPRQQGFNVGAFPLLIGLPSRADEPHRDISRGICLGTKACLQISGPCLPLDFNGWCHTDLHACLNMP